MIKWSLQTTFIKGAITMDCHHYNTELPERKRGQHLQREERGVIQALKQQGLSNRAIARELKCSPTTVGNELRRGNTAAQVEQGACSELQRHARGSCVPIQSAPFPETP